MPPRPRPKRGARAFLVRFTRSMVAIALLAALSKIATPMFAGRLPGVDPTSAGDALSWVVFAVVFLSGVRLWWSLERRHRRRIRYLEDLLALTPTQFEETVAELLRRMRYRSVRRTGQSGDLTADITGEDRKGRPLIAQCKRYDPDKRVGSPDIQTFIGMATVHHQAEVAIFVTTSSFTEPARLLAEEHEIVLYDGEDLDRLLRKVRLTRPSLVLRDSAA